MQSLNYILSCPYGPRCSPVLGTKQSFADADRITSYRVPTVLAALRSSGQSEALQMPTGLHPVVHRSIDDVQLLLARQLDEIDGVARNADRQLWISFRMLHSVQQRVSIENVDV